MALKTSMLTQALLNNAASYGSNRLRREQDEIDELSNDPFETVARMRTRYAEAGQKAPEDKPTKTLLGGVLNVLDAPGNAVRGALEEGFRPGGPNALEGALQGLTHEKTYSTADWLQRAGVQNKVVRGIGGFLGDVLLDPTTYISGGTVKMLGAGAMKGVGKKIGKEALEGMSARLATTLGKSTDDIAKALAKKGISAGDDLFSGGSKILGGGALNKQNITAAGKAAKAGVKGADSAVASASANLRVAGQKIVGDKKVSTELADKLTQMLELDPLAPSDTLKKILGDKTAIKGTKAWDDVYSAFDQRFATHIRRNPLDPEAAVQARKVLKSMTPEQLNTAFNVADELGSQIVGADTVDTYNRLMKVVKSYSDPSIVKNAVDARDIYRTTVAAKGDAVFELALDNGLQIALNALGQRRIVGISLPFSKNVLPLADITKIVRAGDPLRTAIYNKVPGVQFISDWWDKAIRGESTWGLAMQGLEGQVQGMKETVSDFTRMKGSLPLQMEGFIKNLFGAEFMTPKYGKVQRAIPYIMEANMELPEHSLAHKYLASKIAPQMFDPAVAASFGADIDPMLLKRLDDTAASIGQLTDEELKYAQDMSNKIRIANDAIFQLEDKALDLVDSQPGVTSTYKRGGGAKRDDYIYHIYTNNGTKGGPGSKMRGLSDTETGKVITSGNTSMFHSREFPTLAHALAGGSGLVPIDNIVTIQTMRMAETVKHGIHKKILDGIDNIFALTDDARKGLDLDNAAPLTKTSYTPGTEVREYPMTPPEIAKRNTKLNKTKTTITQQLDALQAQVKSVKYDEAKFGEALRKDKTLLERTQAELATGGITAERRAKLEAKIAGIQKHMDSVQRAVDDVNSGKIKPKRGRPTAEQQAIRDEYILAHAKAPERAIMKTAAGDVDVEVTYAGMMGADEHYFNVKGMKDPVRSDRLTFAPQDPGPKVKPWEDYRVDLEYTPQQAQQFDSLNSRTSQIDADLANPNPMKQRKFQRVDATTEDVTGQAREEALAARAGAEAVFQTFQESVGEGEGLKAFKDLFRKVSDTPAMARMGGDREYVSVTQIFGTDAQYLVHKDVYPLIEQFQSKFTNSDGLNELLDVYDAAIRHVKTLQTTLNPSFVPRNLIGEATMSVLHGTDVASFSTSQKVFDMLGGYTQVGSTKMFNTEAVLKLRLLRPGDMVTVDGVQKSAQKAVDDLIAKLSVDIGGKPVYIEDIFSNFVRTGLGQAGMLTDTLSDNIPKVVEKLEHRGALRTAGAEFVQDLKGKKLSENFALALPRLYKNVMRAGSEWTEQSFRLADYIYDLGKGMDWESAAQKVKMFHVDYADLTTFEKVVMRRAVPYYTFMRKNIPMQLRLLVEKPGYYSAIGHMVSNANLALGNPTSPEYLSQNLALPLFEDDDGTVTNLNWNLPLTDLARFTNDWQENMKGAVGSLTPFLRVPFEMATGETMMFGGKIDDPLKYIAGNLGGVNVLYKMLAGANAPEGEGTYSRPGQIGGYGSLLPRTNPNLEEVKKAYAYRDELQEDMKKRKDRGQPIPSIEETQAGSYKRSRSYAEEKKKYTAPHERK